MGLMDFLTRFQDKFKQSSAIADFKEKHPQFKDVSDDKLAPALSQKYPDQYGFLSNYDPGAPVPAPKVPNEKRSAGFYEKHEEVAPQKEAVNTITLVKQKYPQFADVEDTQLAKALETKYPDRFKGLSEKVLTEKHGFIGIDTTPKKDKSFKEQALEFLCFSPTPADKMSDADAIQAISGMTGIRAEQLQAMSNQDLVKMLGKSEMSNEDITRLKNDPEFINKISRETRIPREQISRMSLEQQRELVRKYGGLTPGPTDLEFYKKLLSMSVVVSTGAAPVIAGAKSSIAATSNALASGATMAQAGEAGLAASTAASSAILAATPKAILSGMLRFQALHYAISEAVKAYKGISSERNIKNVFGLLDEKDISELAGPNATAEQKQLLSMLQFGSEVLLIPLMNRKTLSKIRETITEAGKATVKGAKAAGEVAVEGAKAGVEAVKTAPQRAKTALVDFAEGRVEYAQAKAELSKGAGPMIERLVAKGVKRAEATKQVKGLISEVLNGVKSGNVTPDYAMEQLFAGQVKRPAIVVTSKTGTAKTPAEAKFTKELEGLTTPERDFLLEGKITPKDFARQRVAGKSLEQIKLDVAKGVELSGAGSAEAKEAAIQAYSEHAKKKIEDFEKEGKTDLDIEDLSVEEQQRIEDDWAENEGAEYEKIAEQISELKKQKPSGKDAKAKIESEITSLEAKQGEIEERFIDRTKKEIGEKQPAKEAEDKAEKEEAEPPYIPEGVKPPEEKSTEKSIKQASDKFYVSTHFDNPKTFKEVKNVKPVTVEGVEGFITKNGKNWELVESRTGLAMGRGKSQAEAVESAKKAITNSSIPISKIIEKGVERSGLSPRYQAQEDEPEKGRYGESKELDQQKVDEIAKEYASMLGSNDDKISKMAQDFARDILSKNREGVLKLVGYAWGWNDNAKKMFQKATGIKLPRTKAGIIEAVTAWADQKEVPSGDKVKIEVKDGELVDAEILSYDKERDMYDVKFLTARKGSENFIGQTVRVSGRSIRGKNPKVEAPKKATKIIVRDTSVRDLPQKVEISGDKITVMSMDGRKVDHSYTFDIQEWTKAKREPTFNENYNYRQLISKKFRESAKLDDSPEGEAITERMIDSQVSAIRKAVEQLQQKEPAETKEPAVDQGLLDEISDLTEDDLDDYVNRDKQSKIAQLEDAVYGTSLEQALKDKLSELEGVSNAEEKPVPGYPSNTISSLLNNPEQPNRDYLLDQIKNYLDRNKDTYTEYKSKAQDVPSLKSFVEQYEKAERVYTTNKAYWSKEKNDWAQDTEPFYKELNSLLGPLSKLRDKRKGTGAPSKMELDIVGKISKLNDVEKYPVVASIIKPYREYLGKDLDHIKDKIASSKEQKNSLAKVIMLAAERNGIDLNKVGAHLKLKSGEYMPLSIERISDDEVSIAHYYEQNRDLIADPEVIFKIHPSGQLIAKTIQHPPMMIAGKAIQGAVPIRPNDGFLRTWASNIKQQGFLEAKPQKEKVAEAVKEEAKPIKQISEERTEIAPAVRDKAIQAYREEIENFRGIQQKAHTDLDKKGYIVEQDKGVDVLSEGYAIYEKGEYPQELGRKLELDELPAEGKRLIDATRKIEENEEKINRLEAGEDLSAVETAILKNLSDNNEDDILDTGGEEDERGFEIQDGTGQVRLRPDEGRGETRGAGEEAPGDNRTTRRRADNQRPRGADPVTVAESSDEEIVENVRLSLDRPIELTISERRALNKQAQEILAKPVDQITDSDREILRQYTGLGGLQAAEEGVLNQHYTSYEIVKFMWDKLAKLGIKLEGAEALEAAGGVGNFIGFKPEGVKFDVVEMDETASKVSSILYPNERHFNMPFEKFVDGRLYDISIGNDPFGNFRGDVRYAEEAKDYAHIGQIHDFFLVKRLDLLKPNGILAVIVSTGTMDKADEKNRIEINKRAVFLGGYRLPNGIFKKNTHYEGTVDVLFFRKRVPEEIKSGAKHLQPEFIQTDSIDLKNTKGEDRVLRISKYFIDNPQNMWGKPFITGQYGSQIGVKATKPVKEYLGKALDDDMKYEPARSKFTAEQGGFREMGEAIAEGISAPVGAIIYKDGQFLEVGRGGNAYKTDLKISKGGVVSDKMIRAIDMIDKVERLVSGLRETGKIDKKLQANLKKHVTDYWKKYKRAAGYDVAIGAKLRQDPRYFKLAGLMNKEGKLSTILTADEIPMGKREIAPFQQGSLKDAVRYIKETENSYSPAKIAALLGEDQTAVEERLVKELGWNVDGDTVSPDAVYLFGDLMPKIETAERLRLDKQAAKLRAVLPEQGTIETVTPSLLYSWIPESVRDAWLSDIGIGGRLVRKKDPSTGILVWEIEEGSRSRGPRELQINDNYPADTITKFLNHEKEYDKIGYGEDAVKIYNPEKTRALKIVDDVFYAWLKKNPIHADKAIGLYNKAYRSYRHKAMDSTPYEMEGISKIFKGKNLKVKSHQWEWTSLAIDMGKSINAHGVGGGKTMAAILMSQLAGQLGIAKRKMLCVPAKVMRKWAFEIQELFPSAKVISLENLSQSNAYRTLQQVAMNDFDFAIISTDRLKMIPIKMADTFLQEDIAGVEERIRDNKESNARGRKQTERKLQEQLLKMKEKLAGLQQMKRTNTIFWEDLNVEMLVVDEAHNYKNVWVDYGTYKNDQTIAAENNSDRANDLWYKTRAMREKGKGYIHFLTATPTTNKPIEIYSMLRFLAPDEWEKRGIRNAGDFIDQFCEIDDIQIPDVTGLMTSKRIIVGYKNLRDLRSIFRKYVDFRTFENMAEVERPDAKYSVVEVPMSATQKRISAKIVAEMNFAKKNPKEAKDKGISLLSLTTQSRQASVGADIWDGFKYEKWSDPNSKKEYLANNIVSLYKEYKGSGQLIFLDMFQGRKPLTAEEKAYFKMEGAPAKAIDRPVYVNYHEQIRKMLISRGIPAEQIAIVNGAVNNTPGKKQKIADEYEEGKLRILIGTTKSMGEGMDLQADTIAIHNVDAPWTPAELTQRNGRGVRQGNEQDLVHVFNYVTKGSLDAFMYGKLARKDKWNKELWTSDKDFMSNDINLDEENGLSYEELSQSLTIDEDELSYWNKIYDSEIKKDEIAKLDKEIATLNNRVNNIHNDIADRRNKISDYEKDIETAMGEGKDVAYLEARIEGHREKITESENMVKSFEGELSAKNAERFATYEQYQALRQAVASRGEAEIIDDVQLTEAEPEILTGKKEQEAIEKLDEEKPPIVERMLGDDKGSILVPGPVRVELPKPSEILGKLGDIVMAPVNATMDFLWKFNKQKRLNPALADALLKTTAELNTRVERGIAEVNKAIQGRKLTRKERALLLFAVEEKSFTGIPKELEPVRDIFIKMFDDLDTINREKNIYKQSFLERAETEITDKMRVTKEKIRGYTEAAETGNNRAYCSRMANKKTAELAELGEQLKQIQDLRYVTHRGVVQAILDRKMSELKNKQERQVWLSQARRISFKYKHRKGITPLREFYLDGLLKIADVDIVKVAMMITSEAQFRWAMKDLFDFAKDNGLIVSARKKGTPSSWNTINPIRYGIIAPEYTNYRVHPLFEEGLIEIKKGFTRSRNPVKTLFSIIKTAQFYQPFIIWKYDMLQMALGGAFSMNPKKQGGYLVKAFTSVLRAKTLQVHDELYDEALRHNIFQKAYLPSVGSKSEEEAINLAVKRTLADYPFILKVIEGIVDMPLKAKDAINIIKIIYRAIGNVTWLGDEILRLTGYVAYKEMGYSAKEAANLTSQWFGAYDDIAASARDKFSYIFFVYAFRILMPRQIFRLIWEPMKMVRDTIWAGGGKLSGKPGEYGKTYPKRDWIRVVKGLAALFFITFMIDAYMKKKGFYRKTILYKWGKKVTDERGRQKELVVAMNLIYNQPMKWASRLAYYDPTLKWPRPFQGLYKYAQWELHPFYRIVFYDIARNQKSIGFGQIFNPNLQGPEGNLKKFGQIMSYFVSESISLLRLAKDSSDVTEQYILDQQEKKALWDTTLNGLEQAVVDQLGHKYIGKNPEEYYESAMFRLKQEFRKRKRWLKTNAEAAELEQWVNHCEQYFAKMYKTEEGKR